MGNEEIPLRVVCACEKSIVTRYCVVCKGEPECDECYFKRHGNDDLVDDISDEAGSGGQNSSNDKCHDKGLGHAI